LIDENTEDEYKGEDDPGFELYEVDALKAEKVCAHLA
jgi:hypothetical protein